MDPITFCTGSKFRGATDNWTHHIIDGFGMYTYPDGSIYRGDFKDGRFHGSGQIRLAAPYNMTLSGHFIDGRLVTMQTMKFNDGLRYYKKGYENVQDDNNDFTNWDYCSAEDRRYFREYYEGYTLPPGKASITANAYDRTLLAGRYDNEEGVYWPVSGFEKSHNSRLCMDRFVACPEESEWIQRNCRFGGSQRDNPYFEPQTVFPQIMKNNLAAMKEINETETKWHEENKVDYRRGKKKAAGEKPPMAWQKLMSVSLDERTECWPCDRSEHASVDRAECYLTESKSSCELDSLASSLIRNTSVFNCEKRRRSSHRSSKSRSLDLDSAIFDYVNFSTGDGDGLSVRSSIEHFKEQENKDRKASEADIENSRHTRIKFYNVRTRSSVKSST